MHFPLLVLLFLIGLVFGSEERRQDSSNTKERVSVIVAVEEYQPAIYLKESLASIAGVASGVDLEVVRYCSDDSLKVIVCSVGYSTFSKQESLGSIFSDHPSYLFLNGMGTIAFPMCR